MTTYALSSAFKITTMLSSGAAGMFSRLIERAASAPKDDRTKKRVEEFCRGGSELAMYPLFNTRADEFRAEADKIGLSYFIVSTDDIKDEVWPLIVKKEDKNAVNRIYEKLGLDLYENPFAKEPEETKENPSEDGLKKNRDVPFKEKDEVEFDAESVRKKLEQLRERRQMILGGREINERER